MSRLLTSEELTRQVADLEGWHHEGESLVAAHTSPDSAGGLTQLDIELAHRIADAARRTGALHKSETPS